MKRKTSILFSALILAVSVLSARADLLFSDNFTAAGTPDAYDLNFNLAGRQAGSLVKEHGPLQWIKNSTANAQVGNPTGDIDNGNYLLTAMAQHDPEKTVATLDHSFNNFKSGPLSVAFDLAPNLDRTPITPALPSVWSAIMIGASGSAVGGANFSILFRGNGDYEARSGGDVVIGKGSWDGSGGMSSYTTEMHHFELILSDTAGTGSAFSGAGQTVKVYADKKLIATFSANDLGLSEGYLNFTSIQVGGLDNLQVSTDPKPPKP